MSAADLAERISCDTTTIYRYEAGKIKPNPDVMYEICEALGDVDRWTDWMRTEYPISYGRMHPETSHHGLQGAILGLYGEIADPALADKAISEITELMQSAQRVKSLIASRRNGGREA